MGQAHYHGILYGVPEIPKLEKGLYWEEILDEVSEGRIHMYYECDYYLGIFVGITDYALEYDWKVPVGLRNKLIPIDQIEEYLAPHIEEIQRIWRLCQEEAKKYNATLPDGKLLLVYDYD